MESYLPARRATATGHWERRDILKAAAAALLLPARGAWAGEEQRPDTSRLKIGVTTQIYASLPLEQAVREIKNANLQGVLCN